MPVVVDKVIPVARIVKLAGCWAFGMCEKKRDTSSLSDCYLQSPGVKYTLAPTARVRMSILVLHHSFADLTRLGAVRIFRLISVVQQITVIANLQSHAGTLRSLWKAGSH